MREYAGGRPSQSSAARRPSPCTPTLLGTEGVLRCCVCYVVDFRLYAVVLRMDRCADLVSVFFGTYGVAEFRDLEELMLFIERENYHHHVSYAYGDEVEVLNEALGNYLDYTGKTI